MHSSTVAVDVTVTTGVDMISLTFSSVEEWPLSLTLRT